jgi:hypothetical protein
MTLTSELKPGAAALSSVEMEAGAWLVRAPASVSLSETRSIEREVLRAAVAGRRTIVLDLAGVSELAAGLLGGILRMRRGLGAIGGRLVLVVDGPPVDVLVRVSVVQALVDVVGSVEDAAVLVASDAPRFRRAGVTG